MAQLLKVHGSQNSFFILDQTQLNKPLTDPELIELAKKITNPNNKVLNGADGLLVINNPTHKNSVAQMRVINADGSEALMCGNGLRTVARYVSERDHIDNFKVDTLNTSLQVHKTNNFAKSVPAYGVEISPVSFDNKDLPFANLGHERLLNTLVPELSPYLHFSAIAVPNPHLISFVDQAELASDDLKNLGTYLNSANPYFNDGVNVSFAQILGHNRIFVKTFERGVGFTNACGTGMSATSLVFALIYPNLANFNQEINVYNPGGMVKTILHHDDNRYWIELIGNATVTDNVSINENDLHKANISNFESEKTNEQTAYEDFVDKLHK